MASVNFVKRQLEELGLTVAVDGAYILAEDPDLDFERSHDGVRGISRWFAETKSEYEEVCAALLEVDGQEPEEKQMNIVEQLLVKLGRKAPVVEEFAPAPPVKEHADSATQLETAREFNSCKEVAQALENGVQDRGGVPNPEGYIRDMKLDAPAVAVLVIGQRFMAPDGWKIKERRPSGQVLFYGSIIKGRKLNNALKGSAFSLVRDQ